MKSIWIKQNCTGSVLWSVNLKLLIQANKENIYTLKWNEYITSKGNISPHQMQENNTFMFS